MPFLSLSLANFRNLNNNTLDISAKEVFLLVKMDKERAICLNRFILRLMLALLERTLTQKLQLMVRKTLA